MASKILTRLLQVFSLLTRHQAKFSVALGLSRLMDLGAPTENSGRRLGHARHLPKTKALGRRAHSRIRKRDGHRLNRPNSRVGKLSGALCGSLALHVFTTAVFLAIIGWPTLPPHHVPSPVDQFIQSQEDWAAFAAMVSAYDHLPEEI
jgi:hypothetical protein